MKNQQEKKIAIWKINNQAWRMQVENFSKEEMTEFSPSIPGWELVGTGISSTGSIFLYGRDFDSVESFREFSKNFPYCFLEIVNDKETLRNKKLQGKSKKKKKVSINKASMEELLSVGGITQKKAEQILKSRPFERKEELLKLQGFGRKSFEKLSSSISV